MLAPSSGAGPAGAAEAVAVAGGGAEAVVVEAAEAVAAAVGVAVGALVATAVGAAAVGAAVSGASGSDVGSRAVEVSAPHADRSRNRGSDRFMGARYGRTAPRLKGVGAEGHEVERVAAGARELIALAPHRGFMI